MVRAYGIALALLALAGGCATSGRMDLPSTVESARKPEYAVVRVLFATDRNATGSHSPAEMFGGQRAAPPTITYGVCDVSIPREHRMGELESPSIWSLEFRKDPEKHVVLLRVAALPKEQFFVIASRRARESAQREAFVFVHGYNVTFEDAARRTAQIAYDLGFAGAPVFYSWPSTGSPLAYTVDAANIEWSEAHLASFLEDFLGRSDAQNVYLVGHSMGTRGLTRALLRLHASKPALAGRVKEVILSAADIDAQVFRNDIAPALARIAKPITLYASSEDAALLASKKVHGYARAGDSREGLIVVPGIETIDATGMDTGFLRHSYFAERASVLSDIYYMIRDGKRADERFGLQAVTAGASKYWIFKK